MPGTRESTAENRRKLAKWLVASGEQLSIYDADLPDYSAAIDIYGGPELIAHVQEYEAPKVLMRKRQPDAWLSYCPW